MGNDLAYVVQAVVSLSRPLCLPFRQRSAGNKRDSPRRRLTRLINCWQAPNFVWKTTDYPAAKKGYTWSIVLSVLLSKFLQNIETGPHSYNSSSLRDCCYPATSLAGQETGGQSQGVRSLFTRVREH